MEMRDILLSSSGRGKKKIARLMTRCPSIMSIWHRPYIYGQKN